jgi:hypothetical protein
MKFICFTLTAIWLILSGAELAYGEPVSAAIFGAVFAASTAGQFVSLGIALAFNLGVGLIQKARAKAKAKDQTRGISFELQVGDDQPMSFTLGSYAAGGRRKYTGIHGSNGRYFVDVIELGNIPCPGSPSFWVNDQKVTVDWASPDSDGKGYPVHDFDTDGNILLWLKYYDGTQTVADPYLVAKFGAEPDRPFTSDMIGRGCPYLIVTARFNTEVFSSVPNVLTEMPVRRVYDLRKDSTNGGSGTQRWNDQSTWLPSSNPIVNAYNIVRGIYFGSEWVYGGQNLAAFRLPASNWIAAANECDVDIALTGGGTEKQFRCGYEVFCDVEPLTVIEELLQTCNGRMAEVGGIFKVMVGAPGAAVFSFTDADVLVTEGQSFNPFPPFSDTHNGIEATYPEPAEKWATKDAPARYSETYMTADLGQQLVVGVQFEACPFGTQVQRVMKTMLQEERRFRTHEFHLPPSAWRLEPNDVVSWTSTRNGYVNKKFLVVRVIGRRTFNQLVSLKEIDPSDYDWSASEELPTVVGPVKPIKPDPQPMTGWSAVGYTVLDSSSRARRPAIKITAAANLDDVKNVRVQIRLKSSAVIVFDSDATPYDAPYEWVISGQWTLPAMVYQARGLLMPFTNRQTLWSAWLDVTTPNVQIISDDILDNAIIATKINDAAITANKIANEAVTNLKLADAAVSTAKIQVDAVTAAVIKNGEIISSKIAEGAMTIGKFANGLRPVEGPFVTAPTTGNVEGRVATIDGKLMRYTGGAWTSAVDTVDLVGTVGTSQIADNAITNLKLGPLAVDAAKIAANAITSTKVADDAISTPKLQANAVVADKIAVNAILARHLVVADYTNLIPSENFSDETTWMMGGAGGVDFSFDENYSATPYIGKALRYTGARTAGASTTYIGESLSKKFSVIAGKTYAYGAVIDFDVGTTGSAYVYIIFYDKAGVNLGTTTGLGYATPPDALPHSLSNLYVAPAGAVYGALYARRGASTVGGSVTGSVVWFAPFVRLAASAELIVDGAIIADKIATNAIESDKINANAIVSGKIAANAVTAGTIAANAVTATTIAANAVIADKIAVNVIGAKHLIVADWENLIPDGNFDQALTSFTDIWALTPNQFDGNVNTGGSVPGFWIWAGDSLTGKQVLAIDNKTVGGSTTQMYMDTKDMMPCTSGDTLAWEVANRTTDGSSTLGMYLRFYWYTRTGAPASPASVDPLSNTTIPAAWLVRNGQVVVPAGATQFRIRVYHYNSSTTRYNLIDRVVVRKAKGAELIVDGTIITNKLSADSVTTAKIAAGAITATEIATNAVTAVKIAAGTITGNKIAANTIYSDLLVANAITARELVLVDYSNVYPDYDFIAQNSFYTYVGAGTFAFGGTSVNETGKNRLFIGVTTPSDANIYSDWISVESGDYYGEVSAAMAATAVGAGNCRVYVQFGTIDAAGVATYNGRQVLIVTKTDTGSRTRVGANFTAAADERAIRIRYFRLNGGAQQAVFGGMFIRKRYGANLIVDGAITADHLSVNSITVGSPAIATGAITNAKLGTDSVTTAKILTNSVTNDSIAANAVTSVSITNGAIIAGKLSANSVVASNINVSTLSAISATLGTVDISNANIGTLTVGTSNIQAGAVSVADSTELAGATGFSSGNRDASVTITHGSGSPTIIIMGSSGGTGHPTGSGGSLTLTARAGSTVLNTSFGSCDPGKRMSASVMGRHIPASGTTSTTYTIRGAFSGTTSVDETNIVAFVLKR